MDYITTYRWILEWVDTQATAEELQKYLTATGPSIEKTAPLGSNDVIYYAEVTTNRVDMACVLGIAREACAVLPRYGIPAKKHHVSNQDEAMSHLWEKTKHLLEKPRFHVQLAEDELVDRYMAIRMDGITKTAKTPTYMRERLEACGQQSVHPLVDISNYVMLEYGIPSHIFDAQAVGTGLIMRLSRPGEQITVLDGSTHILQGNDIVIENNKKELVDLCGVMGGKASGVSAQTQSAILFVPIYNKYKVRKTSLYTQLRTTASTYFEKGLDTEMAAPTLLRLIDLVSDICGGVITSPLSDYYPERPEQKTITLPLSFIQTYMGVAVGYDDVHAILTALGFGVDIDGEMLRVRVPSYRLGDIEGPADIVEEVARVYGYSNLPNNLQDKHPTHSKEESWGVYGNKQEFAMHAALKKILVEQGFNELVSYPFFSEDYAKELDIDTVQSLTVYESFNTEFVVMRQSLIPTLLKAALTNKGKVKQLAIFELGKVYAPKQSIDEQQPVQETYHIGLLSTSKEYLEKSIQKLQKICAGKPIQTHWHKKGSAIEIKRYYLDKLGLQDALFAVELSLD